MAKVYGYSDDVVCIEHIDGGCTEIDCFNQDVRICFEDDTTIRVGYSKENAAIWWIEVEKHGTATQDLEVCEDENAKVYSDVFCIDAEVVSYTVIKKKVRENDG